MFCFAAAEQERYADVRSDRMALDGEDADTHSTHPPTHTRSQTTTGGVFAPAARQARTQGRKEAAGRAGGDPSDDGGDSGGDESSSDEDDEGDEDYQAPDGQPHTHRMRERRSHLWCDPVPAADNESDESDECESSGARTTHIHMHTRAV